MVSRMIRLSNHAVIKMYEREIELEDVEKAIENGLVIEAYPDDRPFPSRLLLGWSSDRPIHIVVADDDDSNETLVVTVYQPDPTRWSADYRARRR